MSPHNQSGTAQRVSAGRSLGITLLRGITRGLIIAASTARTSPARTSPARTSPARPSLTHSGQRVRQFLKAGYETPTQAA